MEIDVEKLMPVITDSHYNTIELLNESLNNLIDALHIMQSTIENFDDAECLEINKNRMIEFFNKFSK